MQQRYQHLFRRASAFRSDEIFRLPPPGVPFVDIDAQGLLPGDTVAWPNDGSTGSNFTANPSQAPEAFASGGPSGGPYVEFDIANSERMQLSFSPNRATGAVFFLLAQQRALNAGTQTWFDGNVFGTGRNALNVNPGTDLWSFRSSTLVNDGASDLLWHRLVGQFSPTAAEFLVDGVVRFAGQNSGSQTLRGCRLGVRDNTMNQADVNIARFVLWDQASQPGGVTTAAANAWGFAAYPGAL